MLSRIIHALHHHPAPVRAWHTPKVCPGCTRLEWWKAGRALAAAACCGAAIALSLSGLGGQLLDFITRLRGSYGG